MADGLRLTDAQFVEKLTSAQLRLRAYAISLVGSPSDADDILQNASLALWAKRQSYDANRSFFAWACGVVLIEVHRYRRRIASEKLVFSGPLIDTLASEYLQDQSVLEERMATLKKCVAKLNEDDRRLLEDRYRIGLKPKELSKRMGRPVTTLYSSLSRIRGMLYRCVTTTQARNAHQ